MGIEIVLTKISRTILVGLLLLSFSCTKQRAEVITLDEMLRSHGTPAVIGSGFSMNRSVPLPEASLFGVRQRVTKELIKLISSGQIVAFCDDPRFRDWVEVHFENMHDPTQFSGSTMFSSLLKKSTQLTVFKITEARKAELIFSDFVIIVYLEVGDKGSEVRVRPSD